MSTASWRSPTCSGSVARSIRRPSMPTTLVGELLPDLSDGWLVFERERLRQISLHVLEELSRRLSSSHHHELAVLAGLAAVQADPLRETANRVLVEAHLGEGNVAEAVRHFDRFRDLLRRELGVEPNPAFARLWMPQPSSAGRRR